MAEWVWEARGRTGETRTGTMEAESARDVEARLRAQHLSPSKVKKKPIEIKLNLQLGSGVTDKDLVIFVRQFATMIDAGLPLVQGLEILADQGENVRFNAILKSVKGSVEQGATFSDALSRHPKVFDELFCNLVHAGEMGGILDTILNRLAIYIEKRVALRRQVKGALTYPVSIMFIAMAVMGILLGYVVPTFEGMFKDFGGNELPGMTQLVINISNGFVGNLPYLIAGAVVLSTTVVYTYRHPRGKVVWHTLMLKAPILGPVMRKIAVARFTRTLGTLLSSGVPILDALNVVAAASGNVVVEAAIRYSTDKIREGRTMAEPLLESGVFPPMVVQMIGVGEQTGALDQMLNKVADFYEEEVDVAVAAMTSLLEPLMMVVIGGMVGFMLIAMYLPIFSIAGQVQSG